MIMYLNLRVAVRSIRENFVQLATKVHSKFWQGTDVSKQPAAEMYERLNISFGCPVVDYDLPMLREHLQPNLPWADHHFDQERVGGQPLNPGETWKTWPWSNSADGHRDGKGQFNHTYAERFWPRYAGMYPNGLLPPDHVPDDLSAMGIRYRYADLNDVIRQLIVDPLTRQAYIPIWFPEDGSHTDRKPCTLGYHVIRRGNNFHMVYFIRSCDLVRHFQDDIYLAIRLQLWLLTELKLKDPVQWGNVKPGLFTMHITSLHCFVNDFRKLT
jgi:hypothetical protein